MKVIGQAEGGKLLVSASADELAQLTGYSSQWYRKHDNKKEIGIGDEINVSMLYQHLHRMQKSAEEVRRAKGILDTVAGGLLTAENILETVMTEEEPAKVPAEG